MSDPRDAYIEKVVRGKSFADVGGLWGTVNEKVSVAHKAGARTLTMIDVTPLGHELWQLFEHRRVSLHLPEVHAVSGDIVSLVKSQACPKFDVVHCSGVLYHLPNPLELLLALWQITREYLVLSSSVTATTVTSDRGTLHVPAGAMLFIPALQKDEHAIIAAHWRRFVGDGALGLTKELTTWPLEDFGPWWWLPTVDSLKGLCRVAGFTCQDSALMWNDNAFVQLLSVHS